MVRDGAEMKESVAASLGRDAHLNVILAAQRLSERVDDICERHGITQSQYVALWVLCLDDDPDAGVPVGAIADGLLNRASDTTRLVDRMERAGLVERLPNPDDRRSTLVRATAVGRSAFAAVTPELQRFHETQWGTLNRTELRQLNELVTRARLALDE